MKVLTLFLMITISLFATEHFTYSLPNGCQGVFPGEPKLIQQNGINVYYYYDEYGSKLLYTIKKMKSGSTFKKIKYNKRQFESGVKIGLKNSKETLIRFKSMMYDNHYTLEYIIKGDDGIKYIFEDYKNDIGCTWRVRSAPGVDTLKAKKVFESYKHLIKAL